MIYKFLLSFLFLLHLLAAVSSQAQSVLINDGGGSPDPSAMLELRSTDKGFLAPLMPSIDRLSIPQPAKGLLVYQTDGTEGFYYYNGDAWDTLDGVSNINTTTNPENSRIAVVRDVKAPGIAGGDFLSGAWYTRDLNDLQGDSSFISINGSTNFTLSEGIYELSIIAPARSVDVHQIRLLNQTSGLVESLGTSIRSANASTNSEIYALLKLDNPSTFVVQHRCGSTELINGRGAAISWGENVYTQVKIQKF